MTKSQINSRESVPTYDGNGNVSEYLDATGTITAHFEYDPFGSTIVNTDTANQFPYRFSTKPIDETTGLYYYGYRYYDPATGRWPSRDPIEEKGGMNLYGFVTNGGVDAWDYLGLAIVDHVFGPLLRRIPEAYGRCKGKTGCTTFLGLTNTGHTKCATCCANTSIALSSAATTAWISGKFLCLGSGYAAPACLVDVYDAFVDTLEQISAGDNDCRAQCPCWCCPADKPCDDE